MAAFSTYRDAISDDGYYVLSQVVSYLYKGDIFRPDIYLKLHISKNYHAIFSSSDQRRKIEDSGLPESYDIELGVRHFDVSLLALLAEHTCGLSSNDSLLRNVKRVRDWRNQVSHPSPYNCYVNDMNLDEKLQELEEVFLDIIDELDDKILYDISHVKSEVKRRMRARQGKPSISPSHPMISYASSSAPSSRMPSCQEDSEGMPTWGKVLLGTVAAAGALGATAMLASNSKKKEEERGKYRTQNHTRNEKEECAIM